jgi:CheY-like chemotaxis protein
MGEGSGLLRPAPSPVLVVDDDAQMRQIIAWALEDEGFTIVTAADGHEALARGAEQAPGLVILDMSLPVLDGDQVAAALRATHGAALKILMITADGSAAEKARRVGAYAFLRKPFEVEDLVTLVRKGWVPPA